ncbi:hypothetical protein IQ13_1028 [Lacibacter cauensis]|uniref:Uncharacterized protein n=1 Tax=Lacibacter cauensis TaxID=510947 RepID=A0A562SX54_9BACT|nr:hypothetical protein [Lacibacter cauensis]TWI85859.1 hypothetical protein IQ13_1028 [Lacibacter cauensis]
MSYHFVFGSYVASHLLIRIRIPDPINNIKELSIADQRVFVHEYIHFLQNISGGFGVAHIWSTYDQLRQLVYEQQKTNGDIEIPVRSDNANTQRFFMRSLTAIAGDKYLPEAIDDGSAKVVHISLKPDESYDKLVPNSGMRFLKLKIKDDKNNEADYLFGDTAVTETMAYLIEKKFFGEDTINNFPYRACQKVGEYLGSNLVDNDEYLFALCDVAILSSYPGRMFYQVLLKMHQEEFVPSKAEEIYEFGINYLYDNGWRVWDDFKSSKDGAMIVFNDLIQSPFFKNTVEWFKYVIESGFVSRYNNPYFMLQLYRENDPYSGMWENAMKQFGTPQIHNYHEHRFFRPPHELQELQDIEPLYLLALQQINNTLMYGKTECGLVKCCGNSFNGNTDDRCSTSPWVRAKDEKTCAYGSLWKLYGFSDRAVIVEEAK